MKKVISILLICLMLFSLAACGKNAAKAPAADDAANKTPVEAPNGMITIDETPTQPDETEDVQNVGGVDENTEKDADSAYTDYETLDEVNERTGARIARPANVELPFEEFQTVKVGDAEIAQYVFEAGGVPCGVRFSSDFNLCISEMETEDGSLLFDGSHAEETVTYEGNTVAHWETVDGQYVLVVASEDEEFFNTLYEEIKSGSILGDS